MALMVKEGKEIQGSTLVAGIVTHRFDHVYARLRSIEVYLRNDYLGRVFSTLFPGTFTRLSIGLKKYPQIARTLP